MLIPSMTCSNGELARSRANARRGREELRKPPASASSLASYEAAALHSRDAESQCRIALGKTSISDLGDREFAATFIPSSLPLKD